MTTKLTEIWVFSTAYGYSLTLQVKSNAELEKVKAALKGMFTFRRPER